MRESKNPAKFVYDTAKKHLKTEQVNKITESDEWEEFQEFKKGKKSKPVEETQDQKRKKAALSTPNISKTTSTKPVEDFESDDVFADAAF